MTRFLLALALCLVLASCTTPSPDSPEGRVLNAAVNNLCQATGLQRSGPIGRLTPWKAGGGTVTVRLSCDGQSRPYAVAFDKHLRLVSFGPIAQSLAGLQHGLGYDTVKDPATRAVCLAAVAKLNANLGWMYYTAPTMQPFGANYVVTFNTIPPTARNMTLALDAYVSYLVTPRGTVYAVILGA